MKVSLFELIVRAQRRLVRNDVAVVGARAANACMGALVLLLLLGTDILNWRWLAALSIPIFTVGAFSVLRRRPSAYRMGQVLDARLHLADTLSTAIYYSTLQPPRRCDEGTRLSQREQATLAAAAIDLKRALPLRVPRPIGISFAALAFVAAGLVLLRYGTEGRLELRHPVGVVAQWIQQAKTEFDQIERHLRQTARQRKDTTVEQSKDDASVKSHSDSEATVEAEDTGASEKGERTEVGEEQGGDQGRSEKQSGSMEQGSTNASAEPADSGAGEQGSQMPSSGAAQSNSSSGLLSKLSDSLANLASFMKPNPQSAAGSGKEGTSGNNRHSAGSDRKSGSSRGESPGAEPQGGDQAGDSSEQNGGAKGMSGASAKTDQREGSGAGSEDGRKEIEAARQLDAMGKISVLLGKRSQELTGSATVEVTSGRTELRSKYEPRDASHGAVEASAVRDRVPIEFETYVQQYFRELRRQNGLTAKKK